MAICVLVGRQGVAPLLEIGLAEIAAQQGIVGVEADRDLDLAPPGVQVAVADLGEAEAEAGHRVGRVQRDRPLEGRLGIGDAEPGQLGEAQHHLGPGQIGRQRRRPVGRLLGPAAVAEHSSISARRAQTRRVFGPPLTASQQGARAPSRWNSACRA